MTGLLQDILCVLAGAANGVLWALASAFNFIVAGLGAFIGAVVALLPMIPEGPEPPEGSVLAYVNYFIPLGGLVSGLLAAVTLWGVFLIIRIPLRWAKVV